MPNMPNPFAGNVDRKMNKAELVQALRADIVGEIEAIYLYDAHVQATDDPVAKKVLADIRDEEVEHCGELLALVRYLDPTVAGLMENGEGEVREMMQQLGVSETKIKDIEASVGSLIED
ncbi:MAG: demethoxyubiquinone hydroxylase family protein [Oscillospiraceae bacterium]